MVLFETVFLDDIIEKGNKFYPNMIKFCVDKKRRRVCVDEDMHIDMEHMLYDDGSSYEDIYGGNIMVDRDKPYIVWEAHPNIERNKTLGGNGRLITDEAVINELLSILTEWIK